MAVTNQVVITAFIISTTYKSPVLWPSATQRGFTLDSVLLRHAGVGRMCAKEALSVLYELEHVPL